VFTVRNKDGRCPWCQVDHVTFERNIVRHSAAGIKILGSDNNHPSQQTQTIVIRSNLFYDIDSQVWGGNGYFLAMTDGARDITVDHNTIVQANALGVVQIDGPPVHRHPLTSSSAHPSSAGFGPMSFNSMGIPRRA
jgi:hypothetical protein